MQPVGRGDMADRYLVWKIREAILERPVALFLCMDGMLG